MLCKKPITLFGNRVPFGCGQCLPCTISKRRVWTHRLMLENNFHDSAIFLTLTYADEHLPEPFEIKPFEKTRFKGSFAQHSVRPDHHKKFMKDLRSKTGLPLRFYGVGEYGDLTMRPHYHYALYGYPRCTGGTAYYNGVFRPCHCTSCTTIASVWRNGHIFSGDLELDSAQYIAGYVTKKLTDNSNYRQEGYTGLTNFEKLGGRYPEFPRMSNKPGIAAQVSDIIYDKLQHFWLLSPDEVPNILVHGSKILPMGRYLKDRIHAKMGHVFKEGEKLQTYEKQLHDMFADREDLTSFAENNADPSVSLKRAIEFMGSQKILDLETKHLLYKKEKRI